jgi:hypothetical protein
MAFFNKKQEVLDIQLTPYGEDLLSRGKFKPAYYAFFDDDILYDGSGSAGITEVQNDIEPRIQDNTPKSKVQYVYSGPEKRTTERIRQAWEEIGSIEIGGYGSTVADLGPAFLDVTLNSQEAQGRSLQEFFYVDRNPPIFTDFNFVEPMGSMEIGSEYAPSWRIIALNGEVTGAINYLTSSAEAGIYNNVRRIPQVDFDVNYRILVGNDRELDIDSGLRDRIISKIFDDGTFLYLSEDTPNVMLVVDEENSPIDIEYEIEVFSVERGPDGPDTVLMPLNFQKKPEQVVNGVLLDQDEIPVFNLIDLDPSYVEYFFQVNADLEIPEEEICPRLTSVRSRGIVGGNIPYDCPDVKRVDLMNVYDSDTGEVEICD